MTISSEGSRLRARLSGAKPDSVEIARPDPQAAVGRARQRGRRGSRGSWPPLRAPSAGPGRCGKCIAPTAASRGVRSSSRSVTMWMTLPSRCSVPWIATIAAARMIRRCASKMRCQTIALAMPVSSSRVMKVTLPLPGRWRTRTMPATWTLSPSFSSREPAAGRDPAPLQLRAQEGERMGAQRELDGAIILDHLAALGHRRQRHFGLLRRAPRRRRTRAAAPPPSPRTRHKRLAPVEAERLEGIGVGELLQRRRRHARAPPDIVDRGEGRVHRRGGDLRAMIVGEALHHAQAEAEGQVRPPRRWGPGLVEGPAAVSAPPPASPVPLPIEGRIEASSVQSHRLRVDADRAHLDAMLAGVADELGGGVEAHRLGVEQGRAEDVRMIAFHPGRGVGDLGEAGGVAFGEAVAAEALDLLEGALGEILRYSRLAIMPLDHLVAEMADAAGRLEGRHRAAQRVGLGRGEAGADDRDLHRLLLEERHAHGLLQHLAQLLGLGYSGGSLPSRRRR